MLELTLYPSDWDKYMRMQEDVFLELLHIVTPFIEKKRNPSHDAKIAREAFVDYFNGVGAIAWQDKYS